MVDPLGTAWRTAERVAGLRLTAEEATKRGQHALASSVAKTMKEVEQELAVLIRALGPEQLAEYQRTVSEVCAKHTTDYLGPTRSIRRHS